MNIILDLMVNKLNSVNSTVNCKHNVGNIDCLPSKNCEDLMPHLISSICQAACWSADKII